MAAPEPVIDNPERQQFEMEVDGQLAFLKYQRTADALSLIHTEVPDALRGRHIGDALVEAALAAAHAEGRRIIAVCPFVRAYMRKHRLNQ